jgi:hypothetical protein
MPDLDLPTLVKTRRGELGMSFEELYHRSGVPYTVCRQVETHPGRNLALRHIASLAEALDLPLLELAQATLRSFDKPLPLLPSTVTPDPVETLPLFNPRAYNRQHQ